MVDFGGIFDAIKELPGKAMEAQKAIIGTNPVSDFLESSIETVAKAVYDVGGLIRRPISAVNLAAGDIGLPSIFNPGSFLRTVDRLPSIIDTATSGDTYSTAWKRSAYTSVGQSAVLANMQAGNGTAKLKIDLDDPEEVKTFFSSGWQKYNSGAGDFAAQWYTDPLILGGKGLTVARGLTGKGFTMDAEIARQAAGKAKETGLLVPKTTPGLREAAFDSDRAGGVFNRMINETRLWDERQLMELPSFRRAANGPGAAAAYAAARTDAERMALLKLFAGDGRQINTLVAGRSPVGAILMNATDTWSAASAPSRFGVMGRNSRAVLEERLGAVTGDIADGQRYADWTTQLKALDKRERELWNTFDGQPRFGVTSAPFAAARLGAKSLQKADMIGHSLPRRTVFDRPAMVLRSFSDKHPNGWMNLEEADSWAEVQNQLRKWGGKVVPGAQQNAMVSDYIKALDSSERAGVAKKIDNTIRARIAVQHGYTPDEAARISAMYERKLGNAKDEIYSAAHYTPEGKATQFRADDFMEDGTALGIHPNMVSKLKDTHIWTDFKEFEQSLKLFKPQFDEFAKMSKIQGAKQGIEHGLSLFDQAWKFTVLFRGGYIVRNVGDDLLSQTTKMGTMAMVTRGGEGMRNFLSNRVSQSKDLFDKFHVNSLNNQRQKFADDLVFLRRESQGAASERTAEQIRVTEDLLKETDDAIKAASGVRPRKRAGQDSTVEAGGQKFPGTFEGTGGEIFKRQISGQQSVNTLLKDMESRNYRQMHAGGYKIYHPLDNPGAHADAWFLDITRQIANDPVAMMVAKGHDNGMINRWLGTAEGAAYRKKLHVTDSNPNFVLGVRAEVEQYLMMKTHPEVAEVFVKGELTKEGLLKAVPDVRMRPEVHGAQLELALGKGLHARSIKKYTDYFYNNMAQVPLEFFSRHPFANQMFTARRANLIEARLSETGGKFTPQDANMIQQRAHQLALKDVQRYSFNLTHKSSAAQSMRHFMPFMAATQESAVRWSRIVYDKPEALGKLVNIFRGPSKAGLVQDRYGNTVGPDGMVTMPDGSKHLVQQSERYITMGVPGWMQKGPFEGMGDFQINQRSLNLIQQNEFPLNPGQGPLVQIAVSNLVADKPELAEIARKYGVLPFGPQGALETVTPNWIRKWMNSEESDDDFAGTKLAMYNNEMARYQNGKRATKPTMEEVASKAKGYWMFQVGVAMFSPAGVKLNGEYEFLGDEYNRMVQQHGIQEAKGQFLEKYGEDLFGFTASRSKLNTSMGTTKEAYQAFKANQGLIEDDPDLAGILMGQDDKGEYSQDVYQWQLGKYVGGKPIRERISAEESLQQAQKSAGWTLYNQVAAKLDASVIEEGLDPKVAASAKSAMGKRMSTPSDEIYNEAWASDYQTFDRGKYDRLIPHLEELVKDPKIQDQMDVRTDLNGLSVYLGVRKYIQGALDDRKARGKAGTLKAKANADLASQWSQAVGGLIEQDTKFGSLYNRYLHNDMGVHVEGGDDNG